MPHRPIRQPRPPQQHSQRTTTQARGQPAPRPAGRRPATRHRAPRRLPRQPNGHHPPPNASVSAASSRGTRSRWSANTIVLAGVASLAAVLGLCVCLFAAGISWFYTSSTILPGVETAGVDVGGLSAADAERALAQAWQSGGVVLRDDDRTWRAPADEIGIVLDARATAAAAAKWGRTDGGLDGMLRGLNSKVEVAPVLDIDLGKAAAYLYNQQASITLEPINAGVRLVNGRAVASPAENGRSLNVAATIERLRVRAADELADGTLDLVMQQTAPAITDATPLVNQANALLANPFTIKGYDPIRDEWHTWTAPPDVWAGWLEATAAPESAFGGLALALHPTGARAFLESNAGFADERTIRLDEAVSAMQEALAAKQTEVTVRVWHGQTTYTVRAGQTLAAIAEEIGMPYPYIVAANPDVNTDALMINQALTIPSKDVLVPLEPVAHKRIVISRGQQHLWAYENAQVVFDWAISTGIASSPTALGVFQVQTHDINAYADQWNLYMPHFMGFYHPGPNVDLWNGFHGFPTRGGGYLLWTNDLGHPVTYGCVLLSLENAEALYNWAEEGVVVELRAS